MAHVVALVGLLCLWRPVLGLALIACGFAMSWAGHFLFEHNTPAFFEPASAGGLVASCGKKVQVALGGLVWSGACFLRLFGLGPLVKA